ncbi:DUF5895 domain-containing protein [Aphanothece hegewaldii]|uniref:DUF5895 domain-containing protein n=1 Tax=Aphanothece hegewaldii TaxID=1521625 RepID=UPI001C6376B8|nr:DUF5895 domain-containing protein [Aphanothece hegewaldii]
MPKTKAATAEVISSEIIEDTVMSAPIEDLPTQELIKDEFTDASYLDPNARLPRLQALRGLTPDLCGYFISTDEMAKAGWLDFDSIVEQLITYTYESTGNEALGLLLKNPRMLVCPRSTLLAYDRSASTESEQLVILGHWKREYKDDDNVGNVQMYEVILLGTDNRPLHSVPLSYVAKGANQATFSQQWNQLCQEITTCHAVTNGIAARPKNAKFKSLCVFSFQTARELVGKKQKSPTCRVVSHDVPTLNNWRNYFLGYDDPLKHQIWNGLQPDLSVIIHSNDTAVPVLPASAEDEE